MFCYKCGTNIALNSHYCSKCGAKVKTKRVDSAVGNNRSKKPSWLIPAATFFFALIVIGSFYIYETNINKKMDTLVKEGETKALAGELYTAKAAFERVLQKRPNHLGAAFNLEVVERGIIYEQSLEDAARLADKQQFDDGLRVLDELGRELAQEEGPFIGHLKERFQLQTASLTVASVNKTQSEQTFEDLVDLLEEIKGFSSEEALKVAELLKEKIVDLAIKHGQEYLQKNQFTEAEIEFNRGLSYDPTNEKILTYIDATNDQRVAFEQEEKKRLDEAMAKATEEDDFNQTKAIENVALEFSYDEKSGELSVWGAVKNIGTQPIGEIVIHYSVLSKDGHDLASSSTNGYKKILMPNEQGYFEETLFISEKVNDVKIVDYAWQVL